MIRVQLVIFLLFVILLQKHIINSELSDTLKYCCDLGVNWSNQNLKCSEFQTPVVGVLEEEQDFCFNSMLLCCNRNYRTTQCTLGQNAAINGEKCIPPAGVSEEYFQVCCQSCARALLFNADDCNKSNVPLKTPADEAFAACCGKNLSLPETTTTLKPTTIRTTTSSLIEHTKNVFKGTTVRKSKPHGSKNLGNLCDLLHDQLCAQICIPTSDSYRCDCHEGFSLMKDGKSCMQRNIPNRCKDNNPCDHTCIDTGVAIQCFCDKGYKLADDKRSCNDIDECVLKIDACKPGQICVNTEGDYKCEDALIPKLQTPVNKCPEGYTFNQEKQVCDDIDECTLNISHCKDPANCENRIGSYICRDESYTQEKPNKGVECPPGFRYKTSVETCQDIDECASGVDNCNRDSEKCLNTHGSFICKNLASKSSCPAGFRMNFTTYSCVDINECEENPDLCAPDEECLDEPGGYKCLQLSPTPKHQSDPLPKPPALPSSTNHTVLSTTEIYRVASTENTIPIFTQSSNSQQYPKLDGNRSRFPPATYPQQTPILNVPNYNSMPHSSSTKIVNKMNPIACSNGLTYSNTFHVCVDIDECESSPCDSTQVCRNVIGSYDCICKNGFEKDTITSACIDINECQRGNHNCSDSQRCDNTIGSFFCFRLTSCGTGYTLNSATGQCEDDDECLLGQHHCNVLGPKWECKNTLGSFRCERKCYSSDCYGGGVRTITTTSFNTYEQTLGTITSQFKKCLPGYLMNSKGECVDVNECEQSPCKRHETCININGSYRCRNAIDCKMGYEINETGDECVDINECTRGTHQCNNGQMCINKEGYHLCQCPPGHKLNYKGECEDINECEYYGNRMCPQNSNCENTIGSYNCKCKDGFYQINNSCQDIDECSTQQRLCEQTCLNTWGGYRCICKPGFILNPDNRTCTDVDECTKFIDTKLCVGTCENIPGSYRCKCPEGYRLGEDGRSCQDIDECGKSNKCSREDICLNTRGSYQCKKIICPTNYVRDSDHKNRCKRVNHFCSVRDQQCLRSPSSYSYNFITFVSNVPLPQSGQLDLFTLRGPLWNKTVATFSMELQNTKCPPHVQKVNRDYFYMKRKSNQATLSLQKPIQGPQEIELQLGMEYYIDGKFVGLAVAKLFIFVSEYEF